MLEYCAELLRRDQGKLSENNEDVCESFTYYSFFALIYSAWPHSVDMGILSWIESISAIFELPDGGVSISRAQL